MAKKTIHVHTPFTFNAEDGTTQRFEKGSHSVDAKIADHWFVTGHSEVTGKASASDEDIDLLAQIDSLKTQLAEKDKAIGELQLKHDEKDGVIAGLNDQIAEFNGQNGTIIDSPTKLADDKDGKKQKPSDSK